MRSSRGTPASSAAAMAPARCSASRSAGLGAEEVEGADVFAGDEDGHGEDAADLVGEQGGAVDGPAGVVEVGKIGDEDRGAERDGVQAGAFAEGELEFVVGARGGAAGSECSAAGAVEDERNGRGVNVEEHHAGLAEPVGGLYPPPPVNRGEELVMDRHI